MPSSSTFDTQQEMLILQHYRILCARLWTVGYRKETEVITGWYAEVLETPVQCLLDGAASDKKWWSEMAAYSNRAGKPRSDGTYAAGNMVADSAAVLFRFGRQEEAMRFCELADSIWNWAQKEEIKEKEGEDWTYGQYG